MMQMEEQRGEGKIAQYGCGAEEKPRSVSRQRKDKVFARTFEYFAKYSKFLVVDMTKISSRQLQLIRSDLLGRAEFLMGKNTAIKQALKQYIAQTKRKELEAVESVVKDNIALVFTNESLSVLEDVFEQRKVQSVAKPGDLSQCDLWIDPVFTGLDPGKTSFFQALGIVTKITKAKIEILSKCQALHKGRRVGHSEAALLALLGITPFVYKMNVTHAYSDGKFFDIAYLRMTQETVQKMIQEEMVRMASLALGAGYVTESTAPQEITSVLKDMYAIAAAIELDVPELAPLLKQ